MSSKSRSAGSASVKDQRVATLLQRFAPQIAWLRRRLSPGEYFGVQLAAGALLFAGAAWVLGGITQDVIEGDVLAAVAEGVAWLALCYVAVTMLWQRRKRRLLN
jgi:hypothetical protein